MRRTASHVYEALAFLLMALIIAVPAIDAGAEPASAPAGFYRLDCLGNSDTVVSIPFTRPEAAFALVQAIAGNVVTVSGTPGWLVDQFVYVSGTQSNTYYLRFLSSAKEGSYYPIVANDTNSLTLSLGGDDISSVTNGTHLVVVPYWTLAAAFPDGKGVIPSSTIGNRNTEILIPDFNGVGINLSAPVTYFYFTSATSNYWRQVGGGTVNRSDNVLLPDGYFIVRHNTSTGTVFTAQGSVAVSKLAIPLLTQPEPTNQDNFVALVRPAVVTLDESGLFQSGAFLASLSQGNRTDELLVFDNNQVAKNKSAAATYYYLNTWRRVGSGSTNMGSQPVFLPGTGVIIRKKSTATGYSTNWVNSPTY